MSYDIRPGRPEGEPDPHERRVYNERPVAGDLGGFPGERLGFAGAGGRPSFAASGAQVGAFHQGSELSQLMLRRYLLTRAIGASIVRTVHWFGVTMLLLAVGVWFAGVHWLAVLVGIAAFVVLLFRVMLSSIQRRISGITEMGPAGARVEKLVGQTRKGLRSELRRIGLPSAPWGPALIGIRLIRPVKRAQTVRALTRFDLSQVVPSSTLDELHLLLNNPAGR